jgi:hypothetical protein
MPGMRYTTFAIALVLASLSISAPNAHLEPWSFGHPGWVNEKLSVHAISPFKDRSCPRRSPGSA